MMDKDYLYQIDIREWIERGLDADIMVPVSGNKIDKKYDIYLQSFLLPLNEVENDMENDTYNAHTLMPGITVYGSGRMMKRFIIVGEMTMVMNHLL